MIIFITKAIVKNKSPLQVYNFMLGLKNQNYQKWWPGTHLGYDIVKGTGKSVGDIVCMDEFVGDYHLRLRALLKKTKKGALISYQMLFGFLPLPAYLDLEFNQVKDSTEVTHTLRVGFSGFVGMIINPILQLYLSDKFKKQLESHAKTEFASLEKII